MARSAATRCTSGEARGTLARNGDDADGAGRPTRETANIPARMSSIEPMSTPMNTWLRPRSTNSRRAMRPTPQT